MQRTTRMECRGVLANEDADTDVERLVRLRKYNQTSVRLQHTSTADLITSMMQGIVGQGYGIHSIVDVDGTNVFMKTIPITKTDLDRMYDTSNIHNLPMYYHYGVGSAGFGCWRELAFHLKASDWVVHNQCPHFPIVYHYRIVEEQTVASAFQTHPIRKQSFEYWGSNENIERYLQNRASTNHFIVLCLEYFPLTMRATTIIQDNVCWYLKQIDTILSFLAQQEVIHFDAHLGNLVTDTTILVLTDFGLVLDKACRLSQPEISFFHRNGNYDKAKMIANLAVPLFDYVFEPTRWTEFTHQYNVDGTAGDEMVEKEVFDHLDFVGNCFHANYMQALHKYRHSIVTYNTFKHELRRSCMKRIVFPNSTW
jgi:hypothetical protein